MNEAKTIKEILKLPIAETAQDHTPHHFNPWDLFPGIYGGLGEEFDDCAIDVLQELVDQKQKRSDLKSMIFRQLLYINNFCDYGPNPTECFATTKFLEYLPKLLEMWKEYATNRRKI